MEISASEVADNSKEDYQRLGRRLLNDLKALPGNYDEVIRSANFTPQACTTFELVRRKLPNYRKGGCDEDFLGRKHVPIEGAEWGFLLYAFIGAIYRELVTTPGRPSQKLEGYVAAVLEHLTQDLSVDKLETLDNVFDAIQDDADYDKPDEEMTGLEWMYGPGISGGWPKTEWQFAGGLCSAAWALKQFGNILDSIVEELWRACGGEGNCQVDWEFLKKWRGVFGEVHYDEADCYPGIMGNLGHTEHSKGWPASELETFCELRTQWRNTEMVQQPADLDTAEQNKARPDPKSRI